MVWCSISGEPTAILTVWHRFRAFNVHYPQPDHVLQISYIGFMEFDGLMEV
jgi:hypothetical protein